MTTAAVEVHLHCHIPISPAMGVRVLVCDNTAVTLAAPLAPNINHRATVFGGSASAVAILTAWTWLHFVLRDAGNRHAWSSKEIRWSIWLRLAVTLSHVVKRRHR